MKKRLVSLLACFALLALLLPAMRVSAASAVTIGNIPLPAGKYLASNGSAVQDDAPASGGYAYLSTDGATLTLNHFTYNASTWNAVYIDGDITLVLTGESAVTTSFSDTRSSFGLNCTGTLTVNESGTGTNKLTATSGTSSKRYVCGVSCGNLTLNGGTLEGVGGAVNAANNSYGVSAGNYSSITVNGGALIGRGGVSQGSSIGVIASGNITVNTGGAINGYGGQSNATSGDISTGVFSSNNIILSGGTLTGEGSSGDISRGVTANYQITVDSGSLTGTGGAASTPAKNTGVYSDYSDITVNGGTVTAESGESGGSGFGKPVKVTEYYKYRTDKASAYSFSFADSAAAAKVGQYYEIATVPVDFTMDFTATAAQDWAGGKAPATQDASGTSWSWTFANKTLSLDSLVFHTSQPTAVKLPAGATLVLNGASEVTSKATAGNTYGLNCGGALTVSGSGSLVATGGNTSDAYSEGIHCSGALTVSGGSLTGNGGDAGSYSYGVRTSSNSTITVDGGSLTGAGGKSEAGSSTGVEGAAGVTVNGGSLTGVGGEPARNNSYGIDCAAGSTVTVNGGHVVAKSNQTGGSGFGKDVMVTAGYQYRTLGSDPWANHAGESSPRSRTGKYYEIKVIDYTMEFSISGFVSWGEFTNVDFSTTDATGTGWSWDASEKQLSLDGLVFSTKNAIAVKLPADAKLVLSGASEVSSTYSETAVDSQCISCVGALNVSGTGTLNATGSNPQGRNSYGIYCGGALNVSGGTINAAGGAPTTSGSSAGVYAVGDVAVSGGELNAYGAATGPSYGIVAPTNSISLTGGTTAAKGNTQALFTAPRLAGMRAAAFANYDGTGAQIADFTAITTYKWFEATKYTTTISITPSPSFLQGNAPANETINVGAAGQVPNKAEHFGSLEISINGEAFTTVDPSKYALRFGSLHIALDRAYLNTLPVGTHTLRVNLAGILGGESLTTTLTVRAAGDPAADRANPSTGV